MTNDNTLNYANKVCAFTGYRPQKLNACLSRGTLTVQDIELILRRQMLTLLDEGFNTFMSGMAIGADLIFARIALELQREYTPKLARLVAVIPCLEHDKNWGERDRIHCRELSESAYETVVVSNSCYFDGCMAKRNHYLVDRCDELIAVYDGQRGGTMQTINYAKGKRRKVTIIDPSKELIITLRESYETSKTIQEYLFAE
ncbi:MAG: SLOG family protein [Oscillospiraceae bacterium]|nr:SLOG family protein [Oscillospiraceae bacterium]